VAREFDDPTAVVNPELEAKLLRKQDWRIIPLAAGIYLLCYLDRSNIGNAKVLNASTGDDLLSVTNMTNYQYTIALMVFLIAYAVFEVPSNYFLKRMKPSRWIAFLMFTWGTVTMCLGAANSYASVTVMRFLLGVFEAGKFDWVCLWKAVMTERLQVSSLVSSTISRSGTVPKSDPSAWLPSLLLPRSLVLLAVPSPTVLDI
jgi:sugar phosphate permease